MWGWKGARRMVCPSCLNDPVVPIVADTSVVINLNATGFAQAILDALPNPFIVVEEVAIELESGRRNGRKATDGLNTLIAAGQVEVVQLGSDGMRHFSGLVSGPAADTLDDGEAATIAYALEHNATAIIDERKASKICAKRFEELSSGCTVDLLAHGEIEAALGRKGLAEGVFNALYYGRMRVPAEHVSWVINLVGQDRTKKCISLPRSIRQR